MSKLADLKARAARFQGMCKSKNTLLAYEKDWRNFRAWCQNHGLQAFPASPDNIALYIVDQSDLVAVPTIRNRLAAIRSYHLERDVGNPCKTSVVKETMKGITREKQHKAKQAKGLLREDIEAISKKIDKSNIHHLRDIAILWTAFSGGLRRSEIMGLNFEDIFLPAKGAGHQHIKKSKTDQEGKGRDAALLPEAVICLKHYLKASKVKEGALFRRIHKTSKRIGPRIKERGLENCFKRMREVGCLDKLITPHSARVGVAQELVAEGATTAQIAQACGWKGDTMPARYASQLRARDNAVSTLLG